MVFRLYFFHCKMFQARGILCHISSPWPQTDLYCGGNMLCTACWHNSVGPFKSHGSIITQREWLWMLNIVWLSPVWWRMFDGPFHMLPTCDYFRVGTYSSVPVHHTLAKSQLTNQLEPVGGSTYKTGVKGLSEQEMHDWMIKNYFLVKNILLS